MSPISKVNEIFIIDMEKDVYGESKIEDTIKEIYIPLTKARTVTLIDQYSAQFHRTKLLFPFIVEYYDA